MKMKELQPLVEAAVMRNCRYISAVAGDDNPQVVRERNQALGRKWAYEAILEAIAAPRPTAAFSLNIDAKGLNQ